MFSCSRDLSKITRILLLFITSIDTIIKQFYIIGIMLNSLHRLIQLILSWRVIRVAIVILVYLICQVCLVTILHVWDSNTALLIVSFTAIMLPLKSFRSLLHYLSTMKCVLTIHCEHSPLSYILIWSCVYF